MSIIKTGESAPEWAEMENFEIIEMDALETRTFARKGEKEIFLTARGNPVFTCGDYEAKAGEGGYFNVPGIRADETKIWAWHGPALIIRITGNWENIATAGVHIIHSSDTPEQDNMPYDNEKTTDFDRHYHDNQEYWVIYEGKGRCVIGGEYVDVEPGDCLMTPRGWHQDCMTIEGGGDLSLIWFGATPRGQKRIGHLYESKGGAAEPEIPLPVQSY